MATSKTYYSRVPHSTFICSKGQVIAFTGGKAFVDDPRQQKEIEAAIAAGGNVLMTEEEFKAQFAVPVQPAVEVPVVAPVVVEDKLAALKAKQAEQQ